MYSDDYNIHSDPPFKRETNFFIIRERKMLIVNENDPILEKKTRIHAARIEGLNSIDPVER